MRDGVSARDLALPRPVCKCHGQLMRWNKRKDLKLGGYWRCAVNDAERNRVWREAHREYRRLKLREWRDANREHRRAYQRRLRYGIDRATFDALMAAQGGKCAICDLPGDVSPKGALHVDHDHATGRIRGLICLRCNSALERLERPGWTERATAYLAA